MKNIELQKQIENYKQQLLTLLRSWHYYQTDVLQRLIFTYESIFGNIEAEIEVKERNAKRLERKYQMLSNKFQRGEHITRKSVEFIDRLIEKDIERESQFPHRREMHRGNLSEFHAKNRLLDTTHNDGVDLGRLYRQIVKKLHPDIVGENSAFRSYWDNVQNCYRKQDIERLEMFSLILCKEYQENIEDIYAHESELKQDIADLKRFIEKQKKDLNMLQKQEPFCFDGKMDDKNWVIERKNLLRSKLVSINKRILHNNKLLREVKVVDN